MDKAKSNLETIVLGGGCFWCLDAVYRRVEGVEKVVSGYAGGHVADPTYEQVASKTTGHAEVVKVSFNPDVILLGDILDIFWTMHDPTSLNRQGFDVGPEYRSTILYQGTDQMRAVEKSRDAAQKLFDKPIVTAIQPLGKFYEATPDQQNFYESGQRPDYCQIIINPKLAKLRQKFAARLKPGA